MTDEEKWDYLASIPFRDANNTTISLLAQLLKRASGNDDIRFAQLCHTVARDWIRQVSDVNRTGGEDIAGLTRPPTPNDAVEALKRGEDDCDAKARMFVALCLAGGLQARMVPRWSQTTVRENTPKGRTLTHVAAEVLLNNKWWPVELTLARARLGELGENVPKEKETGQWKLS